MKWIKLKKYCHDSGETASAVHAKRRKGVWIEGIHCRVGPDGNVWINPYEVEKWVENGNKALSHPSPMA